MFLEVCKKKTTIDSSQFEPLMQQFLAQHQYTVSSHGSRRRGEQATHIEWQPLMRACVCVCVYARCRR